MTPHLDKQLREMPVSTREEARQFMTAFKNYVWQNNPYGMVLPKSHKPACIRCPDIFAKACEAERMAEQCYWQLPWDEAKIKFWGIPISKWEEARAKRGIMKDRNSQKH